MFLKKCFLSTALTATVLVTSLSSFSMVSANGAQDTNSLQVNSTSTSPPSLDAYLKSKGFPDDLIALYDVEQKQDLYNQKADFLGYNTVGNRIDERLIQPYALDSSNNFSHTVSASRVVSAKGTVQIALNYNWDWKYDPTYTMEDQWGIAWSDGFTLVDNSSQYKYIAYGKRTDLIGSTEEDTNGGVTQTGGIYTVGAGMAYKVNLVGSWSRPNPGSAAAKTFSTYRHKGWSGFSIRKGHDNSKNIVTTSFSAMYFHQFLKPSGSISFGGGSAIPGIQIGWATSYDSSKSSATASVAWGQQDKLS
ncbi:hypothetical protein [Paenibacillus sp. B01]|uniref:hypothetical protein n=1 Tax=Paenibacillus sp. B01 TaxID=2660554 RepID=UPI00129A821D|nr:hypothetical protein [Paenibacillus sp. B01]QGG58328.1 hypothetical protein GE073_23950 [Paenibacillus sp. B01]